MRAALIAVLFTLTSPLFADFVNNGGFDAGSCADWTASPTPFNTPGYNQCLATGGDPGGLAILNDSPGVVPTMTQAIIGLTIGDSYTLSWEMESAYGCCSSSTVPGAGAQIDGHLWEFIVPNTQGWTHYRETFTYTGTSNLLVFSSQRNGTDTDAAFDNIQITNPEPASFGLMCGACGLLFLLRRRHS